MTTTFTTTTLRWARGIRLGRWQTYAALGLAAILALGAFTALRARAATSYVTAPASVQTLVSSVTASGAVNPQNEVSVGTQASGTISQIDVDYNSKVTKGEVLARLDPSTFTAQLDQAEAALAQARAQAAQASATADGADAAVTIAGDDAGAQNAALAAAQDAVAKAQAALTLAQQNATRDSALLSQGYLAASTVQSDDATVAQDQSDVASAQAAVVEARAQAAAGNATVGESGSSAAAQADAAQAAQAAVASAQANVTADQLNLDHTVIVSPVDGTVVARDVAVGQTVAASLQTPTLFTIAQNLEQMEVDINVAEPDIGNVKAGDTVDFSVLAYPNRTFTGTVSQVRINPQTVDNVVTYDVVVLTGNADGALLPGMTANATIDVGSAPNALVVPTAALAWTPNANATAQSSSPWGSTAAGASGAALTAGSNATVYALRDGKPLPVPVKVLLSTSTQAAVTPARPGALAAGDPVVVATNAATHAAHPSGSSPMQPSGAAMRGIH
ncbi:MAG TPA: efflux RND transporter periplasmic adaptor subunit [Verrucomicrobiae bacterium]|nr:efflux RND transporter periplasmic adaptor subunit [Verrucomicrobiae bacterium]